MKVPRIFMMRVTACLSVLSVAGCEVNHATEIASPPNWRPRLTMDCHMSESAEQNAWMCGDIQSGIRDLMASINPYCNSLGLSALARFNATGYGYRAGTMPNQGYLAYTRMDDNLPGQYTASGEHSIDDNVYFQDFWSISHPYTIAGVVAHEEVHQWGDEHAEESLGTAWGATATCGSVY